MTNGENRIHLGNLGPGDIALLKQVADEAAERAVERMFTAMGLNYHDPLQSQRDFAILRDLSDKVIDDEYRDDMSWVRKTRTRMSGMLGKAILTAVGIAVLGAAHTLYAGAVSILGKN